MLKSILLTSLVALTINLFGQTDPTKISIWADQYQQGGDVATGDYGAHVIHNKDDQNRPNWAIYTFYIPEDGEYYISIEFASNSPRPISICSDYYGKNVINSTALLNTTGGWQISNMRWETIGTVRYLKGNRVLRLHSSKIFPHIRAVQISKKKDLCE